MSLADATGSYLFSRVIDDVCRHKVDDDVIRKVDCITELVMLRDIIMLQLSTPCPKKTCDYIFYNNFNNKCPITIIFGTVSSKSMSHRKIVSFPTSPI